MKNSIWRTKISTNGAFCYVKIVFLTCVEFILKVVTNQKI